MDLHSKIKNKKTNFLRNILIFFKGRLEIVFIYTTLLLLNIICMHIETLKKKLIPFIILWKEEILENHKLYQIITRYKLIITLSTNEH